MNSLIVLFFLGSLTTFSQVFQAPTPPRGWNSYDSYTWIINETEFINNAKAVKDLLFDYGYDTVVIDFLWFQNISNASQVFQDKYGRLLPDPQRYPSSIDENGNNIGFTAVAQQIHDMGLKFGIHIMRGVHISAVNQNLPVYGTNGISAFDIAVTDNVKNGNQQNGPCPWHTSMLGLNMSVNGSQEYYDSIYSLYASWGVDFIKNDCMYGGNYAPDQIVATTYSIDKSGRQMVYSLSPGDYSLPQDKAVYIHNYSNMYRMEGDDWDVYGDLIKHFYVTGQFSHTNLVGTSGYRGLSWPDNDMLPLGYITSPQSTEGPYRYCNLTNGQQKMQMSLWSIAKSPLFFGGVVYDLYNDPWTLSLITNKYILSVNNYSINNYEVYGQYDSNNLPISVIWSAYQPIETSLNILTDTYYIAFFNFQTTQQVMNISLYDVKGMNTSYTSCYSYDVWDGGESILVNSNIQVNVEMQNVIVVRLNQCI